MQEDGFNSLNLAEAKVFAGLVVCKGAVHGAGILNRDTEEITPFFVVFSLSLSLSLSNKNVLFFCFKLNVNLLLFAAQVNPPHHAD